MQKKIVLLDIDDVLFDTAHYKNTNLQDFRLYDEVRAVIHNLEKLGEIGILSQGEYDHQIKKLMNTSIHDRFDPEHVHIVEKKDTSLKNILQKYTKLNAILYFVDDRLNGLYYAKQAVPTMQTIWLRRGRYATSQEPLPGFEPDYIIENLEELLRIVKI
jgi:FMN phosphatase YigB (HAD superfamily)